MRIIGLIKRHSGACFHRVTMPLLLMDGPDIHITNAIEDESQFEKGCDAIFYNREIGDEILKLRDKYYFKVVVDVDDYWHLDPHHILYDNYRENKVPEIYIRHISEADVVTTTHDRLAEKIHEFNKNVVVVPNAIPKHEYFPVNRTESEGGHKRIFWQGSVTHEADISLLRNPFKRLDGSKFMTVLSGFVYEEPAWHRMVSAYTDGLRLKGTILKGTAPTQYYSNYQFADVCVAPLVDSTFNSMKSNLKVLEAAHSGLPVIASAVHPYLDVPVLPVKKQSDWYKWLNDFEAQAENARELQAFAAKHYDFYAINEKRKQVFYG